MSNDRYKIDIDIATKDAEKTLAELQRAIRTFEQKTGKSFDSVDGGIGQSEKALKGFSRTAQRDGRKAERALDDIGDQGKKTGDDLDGSFKKSNASFSVFQGVVAGGIALFALRKLSEAASGLFRVFVTDGVRAASVQEDAVNKVAVAMRTAGDFTTEALEDFQDFARGIQANSKFGDEVILEQISLAKSYGATNDQAKALVEASVELAAAQGKSVQETTRQVAKTMGGYAGELAEVFPAIKNLTAEQLKNGEVAQLLLDNYGGSAAGQLNTFSGATAQLGNAFGDVQEAIGGFISKNPAFVKAIQIGTEKLLELSNSLSESAMLRFGDETDKATVRVKTSADEIARLRGRLVELNEAQRDNSRWQDVLSGQGLTAQKQRDFAIKSIQKRLAQEIEAFTEYNRLIDARTNSEKEALDEQERIRAREAELAKQRAEREKIEAEARASTLQFAKALADENVAVGTAYDQRIEMLALQKEREELTEEEFQTRRMDALYERLEEEKGIVEDALAQKLITEEQYYDAIMRLDDKYVVEREKSEIQITKQKKKQVEERQKQEELQNRAAMQGTANLFGALSALAATSGKKQFETSKALATAQAITQGILAIQMAYASAPPPFNIPAIAATTISTGLNVKRIQDQKPPSFATGGIVPGTSYVGDRVAANVNSGEMILNRQQQRQLFDVANGAGSSNRNEELALLRQALNQPISVQIDGREIVNVTREQLQSGRSL